MTDQQGETPQAEVQSTEAQVAEEPFDKERAMDTIKKLRETEKQYKKDRTELERLRQLEEERKKAEMTESERLKAELEQVRANLKQQTIQNQQRRVAAKVGLPDEFAELLKGETPEELESHAKKLLDAMPKQKAAPNSGVTAPGDNTVSGESEAEKRRRLFG
jgi:multidrug resistance efflux pump